MIDDRLDDVTGVLRIEDIGSLPLTMTIPEAGARFYGLSRGSSYAAAARGEIPSRTIGHRKLAVTAEILADLGITTPESVSTEPASSVPTCRPRQRTDHQHDSHTQSAANVARINGL